MMRGLRGIGLFQLQAWTALLGVPLLLVVSAAIEDHQLAAITSASWIDWGGVAYSAIFASLVGHGLLYWLVQRHPVSSITPYLLFAPIVAVGLGVTVWGDRLGPRLIAGGAMVLAGVLLNAKR